ncbi:parallel beta-helix repeat (two copies) [Caenispirillum bisanense]|uniref:Parallel beta-helix repeat (Two copies) n=1 Tax=Caenispirillum bisanense TaxID=414052 RepID=A0A286GZ57_9PROT|nr:parallel beta-helix repeat (two copies) [Caenispirillum bisanense]
MQTGEAIIVRSAEELGAALAIAQGGETIRLAAGRYTNLSLKYNTFPTSVTIEGEPGTVVAGMSVTNSSGITFRNMTFESVCTNGDNYKAGLYVNKSSGITVRGSEFRGAVDDNWLNDGIGIRVDASKAVEVTDSTFHHLFRGGLYRYVEGLNVSNNTVTEVRSDGFDFAAVRNVVVENNYMTNFPVQIGDTTQGGDHKDFIQFWTNGVTYASRDVVIRDNVLIEKGTTTQGIFISSENDLVYRNFLIEGNIVYSSSFHGISVRPAVNTTIRNNTVISTPDGLAAINIDAGTQSGIGSQVIVADNVMTNLRQDAASSAALSGNLLVQGTNADGPNYYANILNNPFNPASADDLAVVGASGVGAQRPAVAPYRISSTADNANGLVKTFSARAFADVLPSGATYHWTFGDGSTARGLEVVHQYGHSGRFDVSLSVTVGGSTTVVSRHEQVTSPLLFNLTFESDGDASDYANVIEWLGGASYISGVDGRAGRFEGSSAARAVTVDRADHLSGLAEMTVSMDVQVNSFAGGGRLFYLPGAYLAQFRGSNLEVTFWSADGTSKKLLADASHLADGGWHRVAVSFDSTQGEASLYMDGTKAATVSGVTEPLAKTGGRDLFVGGAYGSYLNGNIDNFRIYDVALAPAGETAMSEVLASGPRTIQTEPDLVEDAVIDDGSLLQGQAPAPQPGVLLDFRSAGYDSTSGLTLEAKGDVKFGVGEAGTAAAFDGASWVKLGRDERFFTADNVSVSFDFKADQQSATAYQTLLWNHMRYGVTFRGTEMRVALTDVGGVRSDVVVKDAVKHGTWQNVTFEYSRDTGVATVWIDGEQRGSRSGLDIDIGDPASWDVTVGSDGWGKNFVGEIRNMEVMQAAAPAGSTTPLVGCTSTTLRSLALADYSGVTDSTTSMLSVDDSLTSTSEMFTASSLVA